MLKLINLFGKNTTTLKALQMV